MAKVTNRKVNHSQETIDTICKLRKRGLSCEKISKETGLTKNVVLALVYKHYLKIDRHVHWRRKEDHDGRDVPYSDKRPSVPFIRGLNHTRYYVVHNVGKGEQS
jgi:hypothetical protein